MIKIKDHVDGALDNHNALLVVRGFTRTQGVEYFNTCNPIVNLATTLVLAISLSNHEVDVHNALQLDITLSNETKKK